MNIYQKILAIMQEVQYLNKDDHVQYKTTNYKALSEEKVTTIMRDKLIKYNLVVFPVEQTATRHGDITHVDVKYRMVDTDSLESIEIVSCGDGADTQDKGSGKAMTYSYKYMWLRTFALPTGEDPDKISSEELDDRMHTCEECKKVISPVTKKDGSAWPVDEMVTYSKLRFNRELCDKCMKLELKKEKADEINMQRSQMVTG